MSDRFNLQDGTAAPAAAVQKFGRNADIDTGTVPEDIWDGGGAYSGFDLLSAQPIEVLSSDPADTGAGTGARTLEVQGLDGDLMQQSETVTLSGATPVALASSYQRIFRAKVITAGSAGTNIGALTIRTTAAATPALTSMAVILASIGQTLMALYTTAADQTLYTHRFYASCGRTGSPQYAVLTLQVRPPGGAWNTRSVFDVLTQASSLFELRPRSASAIQAGSDIRARVIEVSANNMAISAGFDLRSEYPS